MTPVEASGASVLGNCSYCNVNPLALKPAALSLATHLPGLTHTTAVNSALASKNLGLCQGCCAEAIAQTGEFPAVVVLGMLTLSGAYPSFCAAGCKLSIILMKHHPGEPAGRIDTTMRQ